MANILAIPTSKFKQNNEEPLISDKTELLLFAIMYQAFNVNPVILALISKTDSLYKTKAELKYSSEVSEVFLTKSWNGIDYWNYWFFTYSQPLNFFFTTVQSRDRERTSGS